MADTLAQSHPSGVSPDQIEEWAAAAVRAAVVQPSAEPGELIATVGAAPGAWGAGATADAALAELHEVLIGWAILKLEDGDRDIPDMEGIRLIGRA